MFSVKAIDHIVLNTNKLPQMLHFYCEVLQCNIERELAEIRLTQLRAGSSLIDIMEVDHEIDPDKKNLDHFCLRIEPFNLPELKQYLTDNNISILREGDRYGAQGTGWSIYIKDPEGNEVELKAPITT